jgi:SAM-dependent methyltransferase
MQAAARIARRVLPRPVKATLRTAADSLHRRRRAPLFWTRTALHRLTPGGFGYERRLRRLKDPGYDHARDLHPVRRKHHGGSTAWSDSDELGLRRRIYADYGEYVTHQEQRLEEALRLGLLFENAAVSRRRRTFYRRFRHLVDLLPPDATIVCLGARQSTEVQVLHELGFRNAYGVDLNPGPDNALVRRGDFQRLDEPDASVDLVYSNSLDHALDLPAALDEHARVVRPGGLALYDIADGSSNDPTLSACEATSWASHGTILRLLLDRFPELLRVESEPGRRWYLLRR